MVQEPPAKIQAADQEFAGANHMSFMWIDYFQLQAIVPGMWEGAEACLAGTSPSELTRGRQTLLCRVTANDFVACIHLSDFASLFGFLQDCGGLFKARVAVAVYRMAVFVDLEKHLASLLPTAFLGLMD
jgi:hypothetical protein